MLGHSQVGMEELAEYKTKEKFKRGIAKALGVSPEVISPALVDRWFGEWKSAFVEPIVSVTRHLQLAAEEVEQVQWFPFKWVGLFVLMRPKPVQRFLGW